MASDMTRSNSLSYFRNLDTSVRINVEELMWTLMRLILVRIKPSLSLFVVEGGHIGD